MRLVLQRQSGVLPFNRTIVELKYRCTVVGFHRCTAFNRTIVELKYVLSTP